MDANHQDRESDPDLVVLDYVDVGGADQATPGAPDGDRQLGGDDEDETEAELALLLLEPSAVQSKADGRSGHNFSEAPPPSPEKNRQRRARPVGAPPEDPVAARIAAEELCRRSSLELEVEKLLDNSTRWRKSQRARIRTPVRRAVLSYGCVSPGRRQQILCDLNAKVRELDVEALSRGIACSMASPSAEQQRQPAVEQPTGQAEPAAPGDGGSTNRLDPRVRAAYQLMPQRKPKQPDADLPAYPSSWRSAGRLQSRGHSVRSRATGIRSESGQLDMLRAKTSLTVTTASGGASWWPNSVTKADLLTRQTINGEVQRSLYMERTPGLRRLLQAGGASSAAGVGGINGVGGSGLQAVSLSSLQQQMGRTRVAVGAVCPPATAIGIRRLPAAAK